MTAYTSNEGDSNIVEYDTRVKALIEEGMKPYDARVRAQKEDFNRKDMGVECIWSTSGSLCFTDCSLFGKCWVPENPLETTVIPGEKA